MRRIRPFAVKGYDMELNSHTALAKWGSLTRAYYTDLGGAAETATTFATGAGAGIVSGFIGAMHGLVSPITGESPDVIADRIRATTGDRWTSDLLP